MRRDSRSSEESAHARGLRRNGYARPHMATTDVRNLIETRLAEIEDESRRLRRALEHLSPRRRPGRPAGSTSRSGSKPARKARVKRAARGERQRQMLDAIERMSGASPAELADAVGVSSAQAHQLIRALSQKGEIKKKGQGFVVTRPGR